MLSQSLDTHKRVINIRRLFWLLIGLEVISLFVILFGDIKLLAYFFGIILGPLFILLVPLEPVTGIVLMIATTGLDFLAVIIEGEENSFTFFHVAFVLTFLSLLLKFLLKRQTKINAVDIWPPFIAYITVLAISLIYTPEFADGALRAARIVAMGILCFIVIESVDKVWKVRLLLWTMIIIPLCISLLTIYQLRTEGAYLTPNVVRMATSIGLAVYRSTGTFGNPNPLGCFLMVGIVIPFGLLFYKKQKFFLKLILAGAIIISGAGLITTFSRGGWISTLFALLMIIGLHKKWSYYWIFIFLIVIITTIISFKMPEIRDIVLDRFISIFDPSGEPSSSSRISLIKSGIWMWMDHPIFGVGIRGFPYHYADYYDPNMPGVLAHIKEAHTIQFEILAEQGLIGIVIATWLFVTAFFHGWRTSFSLKNEFLRNVQIACFALMVSFVVNFTFTTDLTNNSFWIIIGLVYAIPLLDNKLLRAD